MNDSFKQLIDHKVLAAYRNGETLYLKTEKEGKTFFWDVSHETECCEVVYFQHTSNIEILLGATILYLEAMTSFSSDEDKGDACCYGVVLKTEKGDVQIEWRGETNSCYSLDMTVYHLPEFKDDSSSADFYRTDASTTRIFVENDKGLEIHVARKDKTVYYREAGGHDIRNGDRDYIETAKPLKEDF